MNKPKKLKIKYVCVHAKDSEERINHAYDMIFKIALKNLIGKKSRGSGT